jgi:hypothetical protein
MMRSWRWWWAPIGYNKPQDHQDGEGDGGNYLLKQWEDHDNE